jgi:anti-sigma regulatory factor (Ser/Thr protein kinase)
VLDEVRLPPHPASVGRARRFVVERLAEMGLPAREDGAELVVSELVTNAVIHAGTEIVVRVAAVDRGARIEVIDGSTEMPGPRMATMASRSGRGLALVDHFTREWGVERTESGKIVWFQVGTEV